MGGPLDAFRGIRAVFAGASRFTGPPGLRTGGLFPAAPGRADRAACGQNGGQGADVLVVDRSRRRVVVQCKRLRPDRRVGDQDVQRVNGTYRHDHGADFAVIVTTGGFTAAARSSGPRYGIHLVDRAALERWADLGEPLYRILRVPDEGARRRHYAPGSWRWRRH
ncbi:restriction endonuclease [Streptomyces sp. NPDC091209]|uniref:restriction endonuclease n=1 Tax=Streptomyces sp. NPDC091209 TaxID=3365974 RepID=UPI003825039B